MLNGNTARHPVSRWRFLLLERYFGTRSFGHLAGTALG
jgi:hypothetical protein